MAPGFRAPEATADDSTLDIQPTPNGTRITIVNPRFSLLPLLKDARFRVWIWLIPRFSWPASRGCCRRTPTSSEKSRGS